MTKIGILKCRISQNNEMQIFETWGKDIQWGTMHAMNKILKYLVDDVSVIEEFPY